MEHAARAAKSECAISEVVSRDLASVASQVRFLHRALRNICPVVQSVAWPALIRSIHVRIVAGQWGKKDEGGSRTAEAPGSPGGRAASASSGRADLAVVRLPCGATGSMPGFEPVDPRSNRGGATGCHWSLVIGHLRLASDREGPASGQ